jgi:hypothetical protein
VTTTREVDKRPNTLRLFGRAALSTVLPGGGGGGDGLPDTEVVLADVTVDRAHLAHYDQVCGFPLSDRLPVTYPHILAFPLALDIMTSRDFPFPVAWHRVFQTICIIGRLPLKLSTFESSLDGQCDDFLFPLPKSVFHGRIETVQATPEYRSHLGTCRCIPRDHQRMFSLEGNFDVDVLPNHERPLQVVYFPMPVVYDKAVSYLVPRPSTIFPPPDLQDSCICPGFIDDDW